MIVLIINQITILTMKKILIISALTLGLVACATVRESYAPDGRKAYNLNCSGTARGWDKCYSAAGELCGAKGYDVLTKNNEPVAMGTAGASASANSASYGSSFVMTSERSMLIACKP